MQHIHALLVSKGWTIHTCQDCQRIFASKNEIDIACTWRKCSSYSGILSQGNRKQKRLIPTTEVLGRYTSHFQNSGLQKFETLNMNHGFNTDFVSAGIQVFSPEFASKLIVTPKEGFIAQPSLRMNSRSPSSGSLSFVNLCTAAIKITPDRHATLVDSWLSFLSSAGLHASRMKLVFRSKQENWGFGDFHSEQMFFVYMGEELGEASYIVDLFSKQTQTSLSDIGFGLERITWAVNWFMCDYADLISNPALTGSSELHDASRTIALLLTSGLAPGSKGAEGNFRKIVKTCSELGTTSEILICVIHFLKFWSAFYQTSVNYSEALAIIGRELDRSKILLLRSNYGVDVNPEMTLVELTDYLMYNRGISYKEIQCHII